MAIIDRFKLDGRTAIVTGGGQGIGRSFCVALAQAGAKVAVADIDLDCANAVVREIDAAGGTAMAVHADVTDQEQVAAMVDAVAEAWGGLTISVNNAGIGVWRAAGDMDLGEWRRITALNLDAVFVCAREAARVMRPAGYGKIINTASMSAHIANTPQHQVAYNTSKAGVLHMTRTLAAEWASEGIRVNSISPGYTRTLLVERLLETPEGKSMLSDWLPRIPLGRMANPDDLQGAIVYLAAEVSDYMTGADLPIDGGYCCW